MKSTLYIFGKTISIIFILIFLACGNSNTDNKGGQGENGSGEDTTLNVMLPAAATVADIDNAKKDGKPVLLVITGTGATAVEKASGIVAEAVKSIKNAVAYSLDRDNAANKDMVSRFDLATVPVPFILVISARGVPFYGGQPEQITADQIIKSMPSPKQDEVFVALDEKKPVFIVISQKDYKDKNAMIESCKAATAKLESSATIVEVDFDDPAEKDFLERIGVVKINGTSIIVVSNAEGKITETFLTKPNVNQLFKAAKKVIKEGGCEPGGCATPC